MQSKKLEVIMLRGLPASGKSTYAKQLISMNPGKYKRVNRDSLRLMFAEEFKDSNEKFVLRVRDQIIDQSLEEGFSVIVDDLNLSAKHEARIKSVVRNRAEVKIVDDFLQVPLDELLARNTGRDAQVPEKVIRDLYAQFVSKDVTKEDQDYKEEKSRIWNFKKDERKYLPYNPDLPDCVIFDMDGTLAIMNGRNPYGCEGIETDLPNEPVIRMLRMLQDLDEGSLHTPDVFIVSGRSEDCRQETLNWLFTYDIKIPHFNLIMRRSGDNRKDSIIKEEIFDKFFRDKYNVLAVFDDRNQVVEKWRELGLLCLQVAPGNF